mmetsp:Transcript_56026/g.135577  ORF Transcript_56026/g.135577 Transcript_56026/m.135577 type:complete len:1555 (+) Transcript_56026:355-5019(+)
MDDSFDVELFAPPSANNRSNRAQRKPVRRVAYGRRGNDAQITRHSSLRDINDFYDDGDNSDDDSYYHNGGDRSSSGSGGGFSSSSSLRRSLSLDPNMQSNSFNPAFTPLSSSSPGLLRGERLDGEFADHTSLESTSPTFGSNAFPPPSSSVPRRLYSRSQSMTMTSTTATPNVPRLPPKLKRSFSVQPGSSRPRRSSMSSIPSSMEQHFESFQEEEKIQCGKSSSSSTTTSPKRPADDDVGIDVTVKTGNRYGGQQQDENIHGKSRRKKTKSDQRSFLKNNFSSLSGPGDNNNSMNSNTVSGDGTKQKMKREVSTFFGSSHSSFSNLARQGSVSSGWASLSQGELTDLPADGGDCPFSSPATTVSRKRSSQDSPLSDDDGTPPKSRSRSKTSATPEHIMAKESPFQNIQPIAPRPSQEDDGGMDMSFFSPLSSGGNNRSNTQLDISMTDDEKNMTADDSGDDNTVCPDDPFPSQPSAALVDTPSNDVMRQRLELDKASVDDIINSMPSYSSLKFLAMKLDQESNIAFVRAMTVPVDPKWSSERRGRFLLWTKAILGFKHTHGGNNTALVQIPMRRGSILLNLLRNAVQTCKDRGLGGASPCMEKHSSAASAFIFSPTKTKSKRLPKPAPKDSFPRSSNLASPKVLAVHTQWDNAGGETDELALRMKDLNMNQNHRKKSTGTATNNTRLSIDSIASDFSISRNSRPSLEHCASNSDFMAHLHGTTTPIPRSRMGRPPRTSLQSVASSTCPPPPMNLKINTSPFLPMHLNCGASIGSADFTLTPRTEPIDTWGSRPQDGRDWGDSDPVVRTLLDELYKRFVENRRIAGFTVDDDEEEIMEEVETHRLGLDFDCASSKYREGPDSPSSEVSQDGECDENDDDQGSQMLLSQESLDFFNNNQDISQLGEVEKQSRYAKRRYTSMAKRRRMSMFSSVVNHTKSVLNNRKSLFIRPSHVNFSGEPSFFLENEPTFCRQAWTTSIKKVEECTTGNNSSFLHDPEILQQVFAFLPQNDVVATAALVSKSWFQASAHTYANFLRSSVECGENDNEYDLDDDRDGQPDESFAMMERPWPYLTTTFPWAMFLSEGAFKRVYKVFNRPHRTEEAVSVMDLDEIRKTGNMSVVGAELAVSVLLSSLVRLGVCPNFVVTRAAFTSSFEPPAHSWGDSNNKRPKGHEYVSPEIKKRPPKEPKHRGRYQYIRQELCDEGDAEEYLKGQPDESIVSDQARQMLFQIAFAIHAAADRFSLKHYDVKLLNVFLKRVQTDKAGDVVLRYGLGEHTFALRQNKDNAIVAKLADYGTANVDSASNGQQVTIAQFTTFENTPPDFLLLGDKAKQGHGHDYFGLGLCMLHLMTGHAPYEEILEDVRCPDNLKRELKKVWENEEESDFSVVRSLVLADCFMDDEGHILEGEPDEVLYDTLYKFLVLFGIPNNNDPAFADSKAMKIVKATLTSDSRKNYSRKGRGKKRTGSDASKFYCDRRKYSLSQGNNSYIARARDTLLSMEGGMELLLSLVDFNPETRATALDVLNSDFMAPLRELNGTTYSFDDDVTSFTAFATHY